MCTCWQKRSKILSIEFAEIYQYVNFHSSSYKQFDLAQVIEDIVVYTTVSMLLIIKKVILFNIYCYRGMIIDAIPSMEEISYC